MPPYQFTTADGSLAGAVNGVNEQFSFTPFPLVLSYKQSGVSGSLLFRNGLLVDQGVDYEDNPGGFVLNWALSQDVLTAFLFAGQNAPSKLRLGSGALTATGFSLLSINWAPDIGESIKFLLFKNGQCLTPGSDYSVSGAWIALTLPRNPTDSFIALTSMGGSFCSSVAGTITGSINGTNPTFGLPNAPSALMLFRNGQLLTLGLDFSIYGNSVTLYGSQIPQTGDVLSAQTFTNVAPNQVTNIDGSLAYSEAVASWLFLNGIYMTQPIDGVTAADTANFNSPQIPSTGSVVTVEAWTPSPVTQEPSFNLGQQFSTNDGSISGILNGVNNIFTLTIPMTSTGNGTFVPVTGIIVWWNGLMMTPGVDYTFNSPIITMMAGAYPRASDVLSAQVFFS